MAGVRRPRVLCGVDGSAQSQRVVDVAARLAAALDGHLVLAHAAHPPYVPERRFADRAEQMAERAAFERAGHLGTTLERVEVMEGVVVERIVEFGTPSEVLVSLAEEANVALVVVGYCKTPLDETLFGSTTAALVRDSPRPVVVTPPRRADTAVPGRAVACGVDGSATSLAAACHAADVAARARLQLVLVAVDAADALERAAAAVGKVAAPPAMVLEERSGDVAAGIIDAAAQHEAGLVAIGSRGRGVVRAAQLGSVSRRVAQLSERPLMIVSPRAADAGAK
jgi:nucleotide-binding universal stress UspA family protein